MLTVQTAINSVEAEVKNGRSQSRYQGNTAGANNRVAANGQTDNSGVHSRTVLLSHTAVPSPASTASNARNCGDAIWLRSSKTGPLNRKVCTYVPSEPIGMWP